MFQGAVSRRAIRITASSSDRTPISRRRSSRTSGSSSGSTTRRTTRRSRSRATSTRPRPRSSSRSTSASLKRGPAVPPVNVQTRRHHRASGASSSRIASSCRASTWRGITPAVLQGWRCRRRHRGRRPRAGPRRAVCTRSSSTKSRSRRTSARIRSRCMLGSVFAHRGDRAARPHAAGARGGDRRRAERCCGARGRRRPRSSARATCSRRGCSAGCSVVGGFGGVADQLNLYNHYLGTPDYLAQDIARRRSVTPDSVRRFAQQYLQPNARVVVHGVPGKQDLGPEVPKPAAQPAHRRPAADVGQRGRAVARDGSRRRRRRAAAQLPVPQSFQLPNGLTVIALAADRRMPRRVGQPRGEERRRREPDRQAGARELHGGDARIRERRRATRTQLAEEVAQTWRVAHDRHRRMDAVDRHDVEPGRNFPAALSAARGRGAALQLSRPRRSSACGRRGSPTRRSSAAIRTASRTTSWPPRCTGSSIRMDLRELGTAESIKQLTRDDLQAFWRQQFVPGNAALVVAGSITLAELREAGRVGVRQLAGAARPLPRSSASRRSRSRGWCIVDRPGSPQTQLRVATIGVPRISPDYIPAARDERDSRRHVLEPHQHESARGERLHLWRELAVLVLARRRAVLGEHGRAHRRHRSGRARDRERAEEDDGDRRDAPRS